MSPDTKAKIDRVLAAAAKATKEATRQLLIAEARRLVAGGDSPTPENAKAA